MLIRYWVAFAAAYAPFLVAQTREGPKFDVASVKPTLEAASQSSNVPLGPGDAFTPTGGYFNATGFSLINYIGFAYKVTGNQMQSLRTQLPDWANSERYDIQARAPASATKDELRLMMRVLLAERFKLTIHSDMKEMPVAALVLIKKETLGPQIQRHPADAACPLSVSQGDTNPDQRFPLLCGGLLAMPASAPGRVHYGGRNLTMEFIANVMSNGTNSGRPLVDRTGLDGKFDFSLEWSPDNRGGDRLPGDVAEDVGLTFEQGLREQLGMKVESQKAPVPVLVVDHVERPSAN